MSDVPVGYKMSEVGVIPEDWEVKKLGVIASGIASGKSKLKSSTGIYPVYGSTGIIGSYDFYDYEGKKILVARVGANAGTINMVEGKYCVSDNTLIIQFNQNMDILFFYYQLSNCKLNTLVFGSGQPLITGSQLKDLSISLPPLPEQQAIASALSDVDALITALEQLITKKRNIKQGAMQQLITGKKRLPGFSGEWEVKKLGEIAEIQRGASPRPIDSPIWYDTKSKVGWVRISDVTTSNGKNLAKTKDYLSEKGISQSRFLPKNSLIMSICATVGIPVITSIETCIHDGFIGFSKLSTINKEFLYYKLKELEKSFKSMGQTGSQSNLNSDLVRNCAIKIPPLPEQRAIAQILSDMDTEIESLEQKRDKYKAIKQGMMQELLTGKRRLA